MDAACAIGTPRGVVSSFYDTRSGERVWIIDWKGGWAPLLDKGRVPVRQEDEHLLKVGSRVAWLQGRVELIF